MNFHSVESFPRDVNCRKRHHSGSTLLHVITILYNLVLFRAADLRCDMYGFLPIEAMASPLPFSMIGVAGHVHSLGFPGNIGQTWLSLRLF